MELTLNEEQAKFLIKEVFTELPREKKELFTEIVMDAIEEIGMVNAIREGRQHEYVSEEQVLPAKAEEMYSPEVFGRSGSDWVVVE